MERACIPNSNPPSPSPVLRALVRPRSNAESRGSQELSSTCPRSYLTFGLLVKTVRDTRLSVHVHRYEWRDACAWKCADVDTRATFSLDPRREKRWRNWYETSRVEFRSGFRNRIFIKILEIYIYIWIANIFYSLNVMIGLFWEEEWTKKTKDNVEKEDSISTNGKLFTVCCCEDRVVGVQQVLEETRRESAELFTCSGSYLDRWNVVCARAALGVNGREGGRKEGDERTPAAKD